MEPVEKALQSAVSAMGTGERLQTVRPVSGGDISRAFRLETDRGIYFAKMNDTVPSDFFEKEAQGLEMLRAAGVIDVPRVLYFSQNPGMIVLEWIESSKHAARDEELGRKLAMLHRLPGEFYGLETDNYIGKLPQPNGRYARWLPFLKERRLGFQVRLAETKGLLSFERKNRLEKLLESLEGWIEEKHCAPSLLHGDLWSGNWLSGPGGKPYLIDPAVFYGDREFELAFTELFGGFSSRFYAAYNEVFPLAAGYEERKPIYQLYYLLVHLNLFGETYGPPIDRILRRYV